MKKVIIQTNTFFINQVATTQEDNHHGLLDKWDLYSDGEGVNKVGTLTKHYFGIYVVLHPNAIRYTFASSDIGFL